MPTFDYEGMNSEGQAVEGTIEAGNRDQAIQKVRAMDLFPTRVSEHGAEGGCALGVAAVLLPALGAGIWALLA
jgi:type II secretory pathway component PulF